MRLIDFLRLMWSGSQEEDEKLSALYLLKPISDLAKAGGKDIIKSHEITSVFNRLKKIDPVFYAPLKNEIEIYLQLLRQNDILDGSTSQIIERFFIHFVHGADTSYNIEDFEIYESHVENFNAFVRYYMLPAFYPEGVKDENSRAFRGTFLRALGALWVNDVSARMAKSPDAQRIVLALPFDEAAQQSTDENTNSKEEGPDQLLSVEDESTATNGGIDLNSNNVDFEFQGQGVDIRLHANDFEITPGNTEGYFPVIINISPATNLPFILGIIPTPKNSDQQITRLNSTNTITDLD